MKKTMKVLASGGGALGLAGTAAATYGLWGLVAVLMTFAALFVLVVLLAQSDLRWLLGDDARTRRAVALRTGTALPTAPANPAGPPPQPRRRWWRRSGS